MAPDDIWKVAGGGGFATIVVVSFIRGWVVARNIHLERLRDKDEVIALYRNAQETTMTAIRTAIEKQTELLNELVRRGR